MKISIKGYITSKESELFLDCADRYAINETHHKFAISDGVSKSFFPKFWAEILVDNFVKSKEIDDNTFVQKCQEQWLSKVTEIVKKPNAKWFTTNAFNNKRPGLATFVGLRFFPKGKELRWKANALGDSFLFFVPKNTKDFEKDYIKLSSKTDLIFDNYPDYLSSIGENHKGEKQPLEGSLVDGTFYLMTDALAEWFINEKENAIGKIDVWKNQKDFERFVNEERISTKLGNDDSAILIIEVVDDKKNKISYSEIKVSNINDLASEQGKEIEKTEKIELEKKRKIEEAEKLKEEKIKKEQEEAATEKKEESKKENDTDKSDEPNKNKEESPITEAQTVEQNEEPKKNNEGNIFERVKKGAETVGNFFSGKTEDNTEEKNEPVSVGKEKTKIQETDSENKKENKEEEETTNPKQEDTPKEVKKPIQKNIKKGDSPNKSKITDKF
jgi:hypothetical protein